MYVVYDYTPHVHGRKKVLLYPKYMQVCQLEESQLARKRNVPDKLNTVDPILFVALL